MKFLSLLLVLVGFVSNVQASNYPPDYCDQIVTIRHDGPALIANVGSGCWSAVVLGYKKWGKLADSGLNKIDAVVVGKCNRDENTVMTKTTTIVLGREWHGTGYMSAPFSPYSVLPDGCYYGPNRNLQVKVEVAFSDGRGNWDSKHLDHWFPVPEDQRFKTNEAGGSINFKAWNFIVSEMLK